jgi:hypothetical protein
MCRAPTAAPDAAKATSGLGQGDIVDSGNTCWDAPTVYYFVKNDCATTIPVTIKVRRRRATVGAASPGCPAAHDPADVPATALNTAHAGPLECQKRRPRVA